MDDSRLTVKELAEADSQNERSVQGTRRRLRELQGLYHGLRQFEADLHQHLHLENNILFPRAMELEVTTVGPSYRI